MARILVVISLVTVAAAQGQTRYRFDSGERMPLGASATSGPIWNYGAAVGVNGGGAHGPEIWRWTHDLGFERFTCELPGAAGCYLIGVAPAPDGSVVVFGRNNWLNNGGYQESFVARYRGGGGGEPVEFRRLGVSQLYAVAVAADNSIWLIGAGEGISKRLRPGYSVYSLWQLKPDLTERSSKQTVELEGTLGLGGSLIARGGHLWLAIYLSADRAVVDLTETGIVQATYPLPANAWGTLGVSRGGDVAIGSWLLDTATKKWRPLGVEGTTIGFDGDRLVTVAYGDIVFHVPVRQ